MPHIIESHNTPLTGTKNIHRLRDGKLLPAVINDSKLLAAASRDDPVVIFDTMALSSLEIVLNIGNAISPISLSTIHSS